MSDEDDFFEIIGTDKSHFWQCNRPGMYGDHDPDYRCPRMLTSDTETNSMLCEMCGEQIVMCTCPNFNGYCVGRTPAYDRTDCEFLYRR